MWAITKLVVGDSRDRKNIVQAIEWACRNGGTAYGTLPVAESDTFTRYENLTEAQVLEWVYKGLDRVAVEEELGTSQEAGKPLPW